MKPSKVAAVVLAGATLAGVRLPEAGASSLETTCFSTALDVPPAVAVKLPVALETAGVRRKSREGSPIIAPVSSWRREERDLVAASFKELPSDLKAIEAEYFGSLLLAPSRTEADHLAQLDMYRDLHTLTQLAIYSGLADNEIGGLVQFVSLKTAFGQKGGEGGNWLELSEKAEKLLDRSLRSKFKKTTPVWDKITPSVQQSLVALELYAEGRELFVEQRGREPIAQEQLDDMGEFLAQAAFFLEYPEEKRSYRKLYKELETAETQIHRLRDKARGRGLTERDMKKRDSYEEKRKKAEEGLEAIYEQAFDFIEEFLPKSSASAGERFLLHAPLQALREAMGALVR